MVHYTDIPLGRENAISRAALASKWNCSDRKARACIASLRCKESPDGTFIVSHSQNGAKGYYRTRNPEEIRHFINEGRKRIRNTAKPIQQARKLLNAIENEAAYGGKGLAG